MNVHLRFGVFSCPVSEGSFVVEQPSNSRQETQYFPTSWLSWLTALRLSDWRSCSLIDSIEGFWKSELRLAQYRCSVVMFSSRFRFRIRTCHSSVELCLKSAHCYSVYHFFPLKPQTPHVVSHVNCEILRDDTSRKSTLLEYMGFTL